MSESKSAAEKNVIAVLQERGLLAQVTESDLPQAASAGPLVVYCGFDPTRSSLQIGNLVPVMILAHFQRHGHEPILVVGGGTGMIGDPSGKSEERNLLTAAQVAENAANVRKQLGQFLTFEGPAAAIMVNNADWLSEMRLIDFLRGIGKHFSVNAMMAKESVKSRLEDRDQGISYTEFSYMVLQATDFLHLFDAYGCTVQVGGNDQWGNLTAGVDLIRRVRGAQAHALTAPLITSATGEKLGKTAGNALYLDPVLTSPYELYQYWINTDDRDVGRFLKVFTFLSLAEIAELEAQHAVDPGKRIGQRQLAYEVTKLIHGQAVADGVAGASNALFGGSLDELTEDALPHLAAAVPSTPITQAALAEGIPVLDALVAAGAQSSKGAARRLIQQGGLYVNDQRWSDPERPLTREEALFGRAILLRTGKNKYHLLVAE
jgi:tyrosyl-tRNA synthetase